MNFVEIRQPGSAVKLHRLVRKPKKNDGEGDREIETRGEEMLGVMLFIERYGRILILVFFCLPSRSHTVKILFHVNIMWTPGFPYYKRCIGRFKFSWFGSKLFACFFNHIKLLFCFELQV